MRRNTSRVSQQVCVCVSVCVDAVCVCGMCLACVMCVCRGQQKQSFKKQISRICFAFNLFYICFVFLFFFPPTSEGEAAAGRAGRPGGDDGRGPGGGAGGGCGTAAGDRGSTSRGPSQVSMGRGRAELGLG